MFQYNAFFLLFFFSEIECYIFTAEIEIYIVV